MTDEYEATTKEPHDRYWVDVITEQEGRARPAVPEEVPEGAIAEDWILEVDGERELVSYSELQERVEFPDEYAETTIEIPIKEIAEAVNYDPREQEYRWVGDEVLEARVLYDPRTQVVMQMDFDLDDQNGVTFEVLAELGVDGL